MIRQDTLPIIRDFSIAGVGAGAYPTAMRVYQGINRLIFFNYAHNQVLQVAAEGGLLIGIPLGLACLLVGARALRRLRADSSPLYWMRLGAVAGLTGMFAQLTWDCGLSRPANAMLAVVLCALAIHERPRDRQTALASHAHHRDSR